MHIKCALEDRRKHGVGFDEAVSALLDPFALAQEDERSAGEPRWLLLGMTAPERSGMPMRKQYDFSKARRARQIPHLAKLQARPKGKTRITIMLDDDVLAAFRARAAVEGSGYQTIINQALRHAAGVLTVDEATLRRVIREELSARSPGADEG